jgi:hypothetical protein
VTCERQMNMGLPMNMSPLLVGVLIVLRVAAFEASAVDEW